MKKWQVEAIRKIDSAARQAKKDILEMGTTAKYDYTTGVLDVNLVEQHEDNYTMTRQMNCPL